jgi:hypothetical protein
MELSFFPLSTPPLAVDPRFYLVFTRPLTPPLSHKKEGKEKQAKRTTTIKSPVLVLKFALYITWLLKCDGP